MRKGWKNYYKMLYTIAIKSWDKFNANFVLLYFSSRSSIKMWHLIWNIWRNDKDNSREFTESAESTKNYNCLSSSINQPKNYPSTYSDSFSRILSIKNRPNFIFCQFGIFVYDSTPKNKNVEFTESFRKFYSLYQWWILVPVHSLITWYYCLYTVQTTF